MVRDVDSEEAVPVWGEGTEFSVFPHNFAVNLKPQENRVFYFRGKK